MDEHNLPPAPPASAAARDIVRALQPPLGPTAAESVLSFDLRGRYECAPSRKPRLVARDRPPCHRQPHNIRVEVLNEGPGFVPEPPFQPSEQRDIGYGLYLIDRLSKTWGVEPEGERTKVWFEVDDDADA